MERTQQSTGNVLTKPTVPDIQKLRGINPMTFIYPWDNIYLTPYNTTRNLEVILIKNLL